MVYINQSDYRQLINDNFYFNINNILQDINIMSTSPSFCGMCDNAIFLNHQKFGALIVKKDFVENALNITVQ